MGSRKYAADYRLEGKRPVYTGQYYAYVQPSGELRRLRRGLYIACSAVTVSLVPLLMDNTRLSRTWYILLPAAGALVPLCLLFTVAWQLKDTAAPFTRAHRDRTDLRLRWASVALSVLLGAGCVGCGAHGMAKGLPAGELAGAVGLLLALCLSFLPVRWRARAATVPANE